MGKSPFLMETSAISMAMFNSYVTNYQRVNMVTYMDLRIVLGIWGRFYGFLSDFQSSRTTWLSGFSCKNITILGPNQPAAGAWMVNVVC